MVSPTSSPYPGGRDDSPFLVLFAAVILWVTAAFVSHNLHGMSAAFVEPPAARQERVHPRLIQFLSLGQVMSAVDALWIRVIQDPAIQHVSRGEHPAVYWDLDLATELDPAFYELYVNGAQLLSVIRNDGQGAWELLQKAERFRTQKLPEYDLAFRERYWNGQWWLLLMQGYVALFELGDLERATVAFREAGALPQAPEYLRSMSVRLSTPGGKFEVGIRLMRFFLSGEKDPITREIIHKKLRALIIGQHLFDAEHAFREFLEAQPSYRRQSEVSLERLNRYWLALTDRNPALLRDPFGGKVSVGKSGRLETTSPFEPVLGLDSPSR